MTDEHPLVAEWDATDEWAEWDAEQDLLHAERVGDTTRELRFAWYGRVSTEDNQDPVTSRNWQREKAQTLLSIHAPNATIVADYFDIGESRSLPWARRTEASRLLADLADPNRGWDAIVVGEGNRCFFGSQFATVAPTIVHHGVALFVPELGGRYDPKNAIHDTQMAMSGGMSQSERQNVQVRVRTAMSTQVVLQGRYQGGRAPYGYRAEGYAPNPNPAKAAQGIQMKRLVKDPVTAPVVARIFQETIDRKTLREIVTGLNRDGVLCPSAYDPTRNTHRSKDGWQVGTVRAILDNVRYTGYEQWGKFKKVEELVSPTEPALGTKTRLVKNPDAPVRSAKPAHDPIVDVHTFLAAHNEMKRRSTGKATVNPNAPVRATVRTTADYPLRGLVYCASCGRKMSPDWYGKKRDTTDHEGKPLQVRYRCRRKDLVEGSERWQDHPNDVTVQQSLLLENVQEWLGALFAQDHRDTTVQALVGALDEAPTSITAIRREQDVHRLTEAQGRLEHQMRALDSGIDPVLLAPRIKAAQEEIAVLEATIAAHPPTTAPKQSDVATLVDEVADHLDEVFGDGADFADLSAFLTALGLRIVYDSQTGVALASLDLAGQTANPHGGVAVGVNGGVRGGT
jgi:DNA invertase Pin-like site-specific DNA recombinase